MLKKQIKSNQTDLLGHKLEMLINLNNPLCLLAEQIPWEEFEKEFDRFYQKDIGRPSKPIRLMVSLLILKQMYKESDESVVASWQENPYWQYFSGEEFFQWKLPCDDSELTKFRNRIGEIGVEKIFQISILIHGEAAMEVEVIPDTTVQAKNITFPTDTKLHLKIIDHCRKLGKENHIKLRQSYVRKLKTLRWLSRYLKVPKRAKEGRRAVAKIKTIAGRLLRELLRKLSKEAIEKNAKLLAIMEQVLT